MGQRLSNHDEYCVYVFDLPCERKANKYFTRWEKKTSCSSYDEAVAVAKNLFETNLYQKVEVQKRFINVRKKCLESKMVKSFARSSFWFQNWLVFR